MDVRPCCLDTSPVPFLASIQPIIINRLERDIRISSSTSAWQITNSPYHSCQHRKWKYQYLRKYASICYAVFAKYFFLVKWYAVLAEVGFFGPRSNFSLKRRSFCFAPWKFTNSVCTKQYQKVTKKKKYRTYLSCP